MAGSLKFSAPPAVDPEDLLPAAGVVAEFEDEAIFFFFLDLWIEIVAGGVLGEVDVAVDEAPAVPSLPLAGS